LFVGGVLLAQAATIPFTAARSELIWSRLYPIVEYDMYRDPYFEGDRVDAIWNIEAVYEGGVTMPLGLETLKMSVWDMQLILHATVVQKSDRGRDNLRAVIRARAPQAERIRELRILSLPVRVSRSGPEAIPATVVMTIPMQ